VSHSRNLFILVAVAILLQTACRGSGATPFTRLLEAEVLGIVPTNGAPKAGWYQQETDGASGGCILSCARRYGPPETPGLPVDVTLAGEYRLWVRYLKEKEASVGTWMVLRDEVGEAMFFSFLDWQPQRVPTETPYEQHASALAGQTGMVWEAFDLTVERPMTAQLSFGGTRGGERHIDCAVLTSDRQFDPRRVDVAALASSGPTLPVAADPDALAVSVGPPGTMEFFAGIEDRDKRFWAGLINCGSVYIDGPRAIKLGFNREHNIGVARQTGIPGMTPVEFVFFMGTATPTFKKEHPTPEGRFVNADGEVGRAFSLHYQPWVDLAMEHLKERVAQALEDDDGTLGFWRISAEEGGWMDYSPWAQEAFRKWLEERHGTIATLNERWATEYTAFEEIAPAKSYEEGRASWLEFREFSGHSYAAAVGRQLPVIRAMDPKKRPCMGANSNLDIDVPYFMAFRPNDFEELFRVGLKGEKYVAFDIYCADDHMASAIEFLTSIAQGRKLINQEFSNHVVDPRIAARTYWVQVAKGVHGIHLFMFQEGPNHATYPKWALLSNDLSPKYKLAAYSDAVQEVHRIEPLLMSSTYTHAVKPVALYWSRIDLGLDKPHDSLYGHSLNSPIHIYRTLRGLGYPVRWITPRQIVEGELDQVGALILAGCKHVPRAAATSIAAWVDSGGAIIGDGWPGAFDEYGQPQATLAPVFAVRPLQTAAQQTGSKLALQESQQGYGEVTDAAVLREKYYEKIDEIAQQPLATHPVAQALGDFMVAGVGLEQVECTAGKVVGMTHRGRPGFLVNDYGKGQAFYSAFMLGTIYEAAPTRYEWDTTHSGLSYGRVLDAFLSYAGVKRGSKANGLTPRVSAKLRVESPLVSPDGNVLVGLTSMNDDVVKPFDLEVTLPPGVGPFISVLVTTEGNRGLQAVDHAMLGTTLKLRMPSFDTHAMILALKESAPLVSLSLKDVRRGPAALAVIDPSQTIEIEAVVHNPARQKLKAGTLTLTAPSGWRQSASEQAIGSIGAGESARCSFTIRAPDIAAACRLRPIVARFENKNTRSTPATEMVWWGLSHKSGQ